MSPLSSRRPHKIIQALQDPRQQWRQVADLLITGNVLACILAIASVDTLDQLTLALLCGHIIFVSWVGICFAVCVEKLQSQFSLYRRTLSSALYFIVLLVIVFLTTCVMNALHMVADKNISGLTWQTITQGVLQHILIGGGFGVICLRYLSVREQWIQQQQAELMARVQALQARIQPHFLFNSLNSVVSLITVDPFKAEHMLIALSRLFRASLAELKEVSLQEEIDLCQQYLDIESVRLGERLKIKWRIEGQDRVKFARIPLLTLQPLLENCIYHGIESMAEQSMVSILIEVVDREVNIVLTNPYQSTAQAGQGNGIAIENVKQRLNAYYGTSVTFRMFAQDGVFTTVLRYRYQ